MLGPSKIVSVRVSIPGAGRQFIFGDQGKPRAAYLRCCKISLSCACGDDVLEPPRSVGRLSGLHLCPRCRRQRAEPIAPVIDDVGYNSDCDPPPPTPPFNDARPITNVPSGLPIAYSALAECAPVGELSGVCEPVLAAWGFTTNGNKILPRLMAGSHEDAETVGTYI